MRVKIKNLKIMNFKGIVEKEINLDSNNVSILGRNGSGKTTIADSISWLLWNKDFTGNEKFNIRPLDAGNNLIHFIDIVVEAVIDFDGVEYTLKKTQKENWVKNRTSLEQEFKGNVNEYEINGFPKTQKDYSEFIASMVNEEHFKLVSSPLYFVNLPWKEQRKILFSMIPSVSDYEIAQNDSRFDGIVNDLKIATTDDIKAKYAKAIKEYKKQQVELPARIDEISKQISEVDNSELLEKKKSYLESISKIEFNLSKIDDVKNEIMEKRDKAFELKMELAEIEKKAYEENVERNKVLTNSIFSKKTELITLKNKKDEYDTKVKCCSRDLDLLNEKLNKAGDKYYHYKNLKFDDSSLCCPTCGKEYDDDKKAEIKAKFEAERDNNVANYLEIGKQAKLEINDIKLFLQNEVDFSNIDKLEKEIEQLEIEKNNIPAIDLTSNEEYTAIKNLIVEIESQVEVLREQDNSSVLKQELSILNKELEHINNEVAKSDCSQAIERRNELENELITVGQKIADCESVLYTLELFVKEKLNRISNDINSNFDTVEFKLFEYLINGSVTETCQCMINGVPFNSLNTASKINAGLDIINTISKQVGCNTFVILDNRESVTEIKEMDSQIISLFVSPEHKEIEVKL